MNLPRISDAEYLKRLNEDSKEWRKCNMEIETPNNEDKYEVRWSMEDVKVKNEVRRSKEK